MRVKRVLLRDEKSLIFIGSLLKRVLGEYPEVSVRAGSRKASFFVVNHRTPIHSVHIVPIDGDFCVSNTFSDIVISTSANYKNKPDNLAENALKLAKEFALAYEEETKKEAIICIHVYEY